MLLTFQSPPTSIQEAGPVTMMPAGHEWQYVCTSKMCASCVLIKTCTTAGVQPCPANATHCTRRQQHCPVITSINRRPRPCHQSRRCLMLLHLDKLCPTGLQSWQKTATDGITHCCRSHRVNEWITKAHNMRQQALGIIMDLHHPLILPRVPADGLCQSHSKLHMAMLVAQAQTAV